jgi:hypothetical protein
LYHRAVADHQTSENTRKTLVAMLLVMATIVVLFFLGTRYVWDVPALPALDGGVD